MIMTAFMMGFAGSLHCLVMCSPLASAVANFKTSFFLNRIIYNSGRILMYGILGVLFSSVGELLQINRLQNIFAVSLGCILIVAGLVGAGKFRSSFMMKPAIAIQGIIRKLFTSMLQRKTLPSMLILGMINGLLPCGLTFIALAYCVTLPALTNGFVFMIAFGAGTLPVMLGVTSLAGSAMSRLKFSRAIPALILVVMGCLLISRTMIHHAPALSNRESTPIVICR